MILINHIEINRPYIHFKGKLYYVHNIAENSETGEKMVIYQMLYPPYEMYCRSLEMFSEKIDINRKGNITGQTNRFVLFNGDLNLNK